MEEKELTQEEVNQDLANVGMELVEEPTESAPQPTEAPKPIDNKADEEKRDREYNFRRMREDNERIAKEKLELEYRLAQYEKNIPPKVEEEDNDGLADDDFVQKSHFRAYKRDARELKKQNAEIRQRLEEQALELKVRSEMPDFTKVVNDDTVAELYKQRPKLAAALAKTPNDFDKMAAIYDAVSTLRKDEYTAEKKAVQATAQRPRSAATLAPKTGNSPLDQAQDFANGLSDEQKKTLWDEMNGYANNT